jgi:hypothetical protein
MTHYISLEVDISSVVLLDIFKITDLLSNNSASMLYYFI